MELSPVRIDAQTTHDDDTAASIRDRFLAGRPDITTFTFLLIAPQNNTQRDTATFSDLISKDVRHLLNQRQISNCMPCPVTTPWEKCPDTRVTMSQTKSGLAFYIRGTL